MHNVKVVKYYNVNCDDYLGFLGDQFHFGFWHDNTKDIFEAMNNANQAVADALDIREGDRILDAGCGVGGTVRYIAARYNVGEIVGITITPRLVDLCHKLSKGHDRQHVINFFEMDYCHTLFTNEYYNKIYAIESVCHTSDKNGFAKEAFRLLQPGGILVINDYSRTDTPFPNDAVERNYKKFLQGWALHHLETVNGMKKILADVGFQEISYDDKTDLIMQFSQIIKNVKYEQLPDIANAVADGLTPKEVLGHAIATVVQEDLFKHSVMQQGIFKAIKKN